MPTIARPSPPSPGAPDANHSTALPTQERPMPAKGCYRDPYCFGQASEWHRVLRRRPRRDFDFTDSAELRFRRLCRTSISPTSTLPNFDFADVDSTELRLA